MLRRLALIILPVLGLACARATTDSPDLILAHVAVIHVEDGSVGEDQTVVVHGNRILSVTPSSSKTPKGRVIDCRGKYLIPGLWDMHVHSQLGQEQTLRLLVANGVTGVRDMGSDLNVILALRDGVRRGEVIGPRIAAAGPILDAGPPDWPFRYNVATDSAARVAVDSLRRSRVDFIKVHTAIPREAYFAAAAAARDAGLPLAGHLPSSVSYAEAIASGQRSIEHLAEMGLVVECSDPARRLELCSEFEKHSIWQTPTLSFWRRVASYDPEHRPDDALAAYSPPALTKFWSDLESEFLAKQSPEQRAMMRRLYEEAVPLVGAMHRAGVPLLAGTDTAGGPGFGLHDELDLLVEAGLSPTETIRIATLGPARYFAATDSLGGIAPNQIADLVILSGNPLEEIHHTRAIAGVVLNGRYFDRAALDELLAASKSGG